LENLEKTWIVGARMIHQLKEQESDDSGDGDGSSDGEDSDAE
jgi:translation initiation factor eIF-2B subunit epsilon